MRVLTFILLFFVIVSLQNSVHGSDDLARGQRTSRRGQRAMQRQLEQSPEQFNQFGFDAPSNYSHQYGINEQLHRLQVSGEQQHEVPDQNAMMFYPPHFSTYHHGGLELPLLPPISTQHRHIGSSSSSTPHSATPRPVSFENMELRMRQHAETFFGPNSNQGEATAPTSIFEGDIISIMIAGQKYVEYGELYQKTGSDEEWKYNDGAPDVPERVYIHIWNVQYRNRDGGVKRRTVYSRFAAKPAPHSFDPPAKNQISVCFIRGHENVYYAELSTKALENVSTMRGTVHLRARYLKNNAYFRFYGEIKVWPRNSPIPQWVASGN